MSRLQLSKILFMARRFPPSIGGMERFAYDLTEALGPKVKLHLIKWGGSNIFLPLVLPIFFVRAFWALLTKKIDIIHIQDGLQSPMGVVLKFIFRKPLIVVIHGLDITYKNRLYQAVVPRALKRADYIFCISNMAVGEVIKRGVPANKISFAPLGMTDELNESDKPAARKKIIDELKLDVDTKIILSAGRLVKRKGVEWFVSNVMPELVKVNGKIVLVVSGDGPEKAAIEQAIKTRGLRSNVFLLGQTNDQILKNLYNGSDVFVMPNIKVEGDREGFGRVMLEAALCELPVVATGIEGIVDAVIDGKNGILVKEKDVKVYVVTITTLINDASASRKMGKAARQFTLKNFDWDNIANQYVAEYKKLLS